MTEFENTGETRGERITIEVSNVGGIDHLERAVDVGATLVAGPNASNKTSLLQGVEFALGGDSASIQSGAETASVTLSGSDFAVTRRLKRDDDRVRSEGEPLLGDDGDAAPLVTFTSLLEFNPLRTAVRSGDSVEALLKRPLDLDELERERETLLARKHQLSTEIDELDGVGDEIREVETQVERVEDRITALEAELSDLRDERADAAGETDEITSLREERAALVAKRNRLRDEVDELSQTVERYEEQLAEYDAEIESLEASVQGDDADSVREQRARLEDRLDEIDERIATIQSAVTANRELLQSDLRGLLGESHSLSGDELTCWTCGAERPVADFEETLETMADRVAAERERKESITPKLASLESDLAEIEEQRSRLRNARSERQETKETLDRRRGSLATKRDLLAEVMTELADVDERIEAAQQDTPETAAELSERIESVQLDLHTARTERERLGSRLDDLRAEQERLERLRSERTDVDERIEELTTRIDGTERELRESFNEAMAEILELLAFDDIARVWLDGEFQVIVARDVDGTVHREPVAHLSESEREAIGLVLGLAGYLTYDLDERSPILLVDSVGAFDIDRLETLVEFLADRTTYLLVAVYPEIADELPYARMDIEA
jgi:chromosome segregation ATPase